MARQSKIDVFKRNTLVGHKDSVFTLEKSSEKDKVFSSGADGFLVEWDLNNPNDGRVLAKVPSSVYCMHRDSVENTLIIGQNLDGIHLIDLSTRKEIGSLQLGKTSFFSIGTNHEVIVVGDKSGMVYVVDKKRLTVKKKLQVTNKSIRSITVRSDGQEMLIGSSDHQIRVYDMETFMLKKAITGHENSVFSVRYFQDSNLILSGGRDAHLKVWDAKSYTLVEDIAAHLYTINNVCLSTDEKYFASCSMDKTIKVWDAETLKLLKVIDKDRHEGHTNSVNKLMWLPNQNSLISCSDDRTVAVWDINFNSDQQ